MFNHLKLQLIKIKIVLEFIKLLNCFKILLLLCNVWNTRFLKEMRNFYTNCSGVVDTQYRLFLKSNIFKGCNVICVYQTVNSGELLEALIFMMGFCNYLCEQKGYNITSH